MIRFAVLLGVFSLVASAQDAVTPIQQAITANGQVATALTQALTAAQALTSSNTALSAQVATLQAQIAAMTPVPGSQGVVNYYSLMQSNWNPYLTSTDPAMQAWIKAHVNLPGSYTPFFDNKLAWLPKTQVYVDSYAILVNDPLVSSHPEYIATDVLGNRLYIPWGCSGGTCPQYAGDLTNANFRAYMVAKVRSAVAPGYAGIFFDDVNMTVTTSNGNAVIVAPRDPATGNAMTQAAWETYMVAYLNQIRAAIPSLKITQNSVWLAGSPASDPNILAQMQAADLVNFERGFGDSGITGGTGASSLGTYMSFMDAVHNVPRPVNIQDYHTANEAYSLACYFLVQQPGDSIGFQDESYLNWDSQKLYGVNLGAAKAWRFWNGQGLWERDYVNGIVYVNEPGAAPKTLVVPVGLHYVGGAAVSQITLQASQGVILVSN